MQEDAQALIKQLLQEGQRYGDIRRELISRGFGTKGFEEAYPVIQKELGITEPPPTSVAPKPVDPVSHSSAEKAENIIVPPRSNLLPNVFKLLTGLLVIAVIIIVVSGYGNQLTHMLIDEEGGRNLNAQDLAHEAKLRTMQASATVYKDRLLDYQGVCESIGIDQGTYTCKETMDAYVMYAQLSDGTYYCVDSTGFVGIIGAVSTNNLSCQ